MPIYTFYPCLRDGSSTTFEVYELEGDNAARERAVLLLKQHPTSVYVTIWQGDRPVQGAPPLGSAASPAPTPPAGESAHTMPATGV